MKDKKSIEVLLRLRDKYPLTKEEQEALSNAIGILSWASLAESRIKTLKKKKENNL